ncbi:alcohol dehydrogenase [Serratia sp. FS14]|uniref:NADP-dependent oxidoreductase n=1 Tax=Serratia sp. (strain FS14) TaxID=1327989 RepID=UPI0004997F01|nr:NADP-dependent oxidoreductase [Serratia sp. FS14]AIA48786.1 alcohol dehydrogenase [Serratia sp. FS14]
MQAIAVESFGATPTLMTVPTPQPAHGQLLVKLEASGINPIDWRIAQGMLKDRLPHVFPLIMGVDGVGTVTAVGTGVQRFRVGDQVVGQFLFGQAGNGSHAGYAVLNEEATLVLCPETVEAVQAAALPTAGITALQLSQRLDIAPGGTVLIIGATGGVGTFLTQWAVMKGLRVIATANQDAQAHMRALGAVETLDYHQTPIDAWLAAHYRQGVDALVDLVSDSADFALYATHVRRGGVALSSVWAAQEQSLAAREIRGGNFEVRATANDLGIVLTAAASGKLKVTIDQTIPLAQGAKALLANRAGGARGKTILVR